MYNSDAVAKENRTDRDGLNEVERSNFESYDRALVILLTSTFGFSFLAVSYIVEVWGVLLYVSLLLGGWVLLAAAIILFLGNFYIAYKDVEYRRKDLDNKRPYNNRLRKLIVKINWTVGVLYIASIILIMLFVALNI